MYAQQVAGPLTEDPGVFVGAPNDPVFHTIRSLGWRWNNQGAFVYVNVDGAMHCVHVPIQVVHDIFDRELGAVGCPLARGSSVGEPVSVGGFFSRLRRAISKATNTVKGAVSKAASGVNWVAQKAVRPVVRGASAVLNNQIVRTIAGNIPVISTYYGAARTALNVADSALAWLNNPSLRGLGSIVTRGVSSAAGMIPGGNAVMQVAELAAPMALKALGPTHHGAPALNAARQALGPQLMRAAPAAAMRSVWGGAPRFSPVVLPRYPSLGSYGWVR